MIRYRFFLALSIGFLAAVLACSWGDERLQARISRLVANDLEQATIELHVCPRAPRELGSATVAELLRQIATLKPSASIGKQEAWDTWRTVTLKTKRGETFEISVGTRPSLAGAPVVILEQKPSGGIGFYGGDVFWLWLQSTPESVALLAPADTAPCTS